MTGKVTTEVISRRRALSFLGLAAMSLAVPTTLLTVSDAEAQRPSPPAQTPGQAPTTNTPTTNAPTTNAPTTTGQTGTERRQERRTRRVKRRVRRRTARKTGRSQRRQLRRTGTE